MEWVEQNQKAKDLFAKYDPKYQTLEQFKVFRPFHPYTEEDAGNILKMINKANKSEYYYKTLNERMGKKKVGYMG